MSKRHPILQYVIFREHILFTIGGGIYEPEHISITVPKKLFFEIVEKITASQLAVQADSEIRTKCAILDQACVDCEEDCPAAGAA